MAGCESARSFCSIQVLRAKIPEEQVATFGNFLPRNDSSVVAHKLSRCL